MKTHKIRLLKNSLVLLTLVIATQFSLRAGDDTNSNVWGQISIWSGAKFSNPYIINGTTKTLESAGSSTDGYIEINLSSRYVLRQGAEASDPVWTNKNKTIDNGLIEFVNPIAHMPDIDSRFGYIFRGNSVPTNYSASTIVGTSDFYLDTSIGLPLIRYCSKEYKWKQQLSLELNGGFATDKEHLNLHPSAFLGLGWQGSVPLQNDRQGYWIGRAGCALIDQPTLVNGKSTVQFDGMQQPVFNEKFVPSTGVIVVYPLTESISFQAGVNAYFTDDPPASWNATLGATMDLSVISKFCSSIIKAVGN